MQMNVAGFALDTGNHLLQPDRQRAANRLQALRLLSQPVICQPVVAQGRQPAYFLPDAGQTRLAAAIRRRQPQRQHLRSTVDHGHRRTQLMRQHGNKAALLVQIPLLVGQRQLELRLTLQQQSLGTLPFADFLAQQPGPLVHLRVQPPAQCPGTGQSGDLCQCLFLLPAKSPERKAGTHEYHLQQVRPDSQHVVQLPRLQYAQQTQEIHVDADAVHRQTGQKPVTQLQPALADLPPAHPRQPVDQYQRQQQDQRHQHAVTAKRHDKAAQSCQKVGQHNGPVRPWCTSPGFQDPGKAQVGQHDGQQERQPRRIERPGRVFGMQVTYRQSHGSRQRHTAANEVRGVKQIDRFPGGPPPYQRQQPDQQQCTKKQSLPEQGVLHVHEIGGFAVDHRISLHGAACADPQQVQRLSDRSQPECRHRDRHPSSGKRQGVADALFLPVTGMSGKQADTIQYGRRNL